MNKTTTYQKLKELNADLGKDELLESILFGMPKDYTYKASAKTDKEIWYEEASSKYE